MARKRYDRDFKISAVRLVTEQGYTLDQAAKSLGISSQSIREWKVKLAKEGVACLCSNIARRLSADVYRHPAV